VNFVAARFSLRELAMKQRGEHGDHEDNCPLCNDLDVRIVRNAMDAAEAEIARLTEQVGILDRTLTEVTKDWEDNA
jgi:hypothetical protein